VKEVAMTVFLSYAHQDAELAKALRQDLIDIGQSVWLDESLNGGQIWWDEILRQVRDCHVFVLAISAHSLASEACLSEWAYAEELARPFLPIRIDDSDLTSAPDAMKQTQHIDFQVGNAQSAKALAKSLSSVPASVPLPAVLPTPPPTPLSYRERYAKLFASEPLTVDDQITYFIRLTLDVDGINVTEALELIRALHDRDDVSFKVRQRIEEFLGDRGISTASPIPPSVERVDDAPPADSGQGENENQTDAVLETTSVQRRTKRLYWGLAAAAALVLAIVGAVLLWPDSDGEEPIAAENISCDADTCYSPPIRFIDLEGVADEIQVTLTDPHGHEVQGVDPPYLTDNSTVEWTWNAQNEDPIGVYSVQFSSAGAATVERTFTVTPIEGPFGVVQRAAEAIADHDWEAAAAIDDRIAGELDEYGTEFLEVEYPTAGDTHWVPVDASGQTNANGTTIIGAAVVYNESEETTTAYCELWSVNADGVTMRSDPLPRDGQQEHLSTTGHEAPSEFKPWIEEKCPEAAEPS
jgi:hypothetical protein